MTKEQIAALLRDRRRDMGLTGGEVVQKLKAYNINISPKTLWGYENENSSPPVPTFIALCKIYEVEDVVSEVKEKPVNEKLNYREKLLLDYFRQASPEAQDLVLKMLKPEEQDTASLVG